METKKQISGFYTAQTFLTQEQFDKMFPNKCRCESVQESIQNAFLMDDSRLLLNGTAHGIAFLIGCDVNKELAAAKSLSVEDVKKLDIKESYDILKWFVEQYVPLSSDDNAEILDIINEIKISDDDICMSRDYAWIDIKINKKQQKRLAERLSASFGTIVEPSSIVVTYSPADYGIEDDVQIKFKDNEYTYEIGKKSHLPQSSLYPSFVNFDDLYAE